MSGTPVTWRRATAAALALRLSVAVPGGLALFLAMPGPYASGGFWPFVALLMALGSAVRPQAGAVGLIMGTSVLFWLIATVVYGRPADPLVAFAIGALLYVHHSAAALASQVPVSTDLPPGVVTGWAVRAGAVLLGSALLGLAIVAAPALPAAVAVPLGAAGAVGVVLLTRRLIRS